MKNYITLVGALSAAKLAVALPTAVTLSWFVSADGGTTWSNHATVSSPGEVRVQATLSWQNSPFGAVGLGLSYARFDCTLTELTPQDFASDIVRLLIPPAGDQNLVFTNFFGRTGKIDADTDHSAAGAGAGWCETGQASPLSLGPYFSVDNSVTQLSYTFHISGADHTASLGAIMSNSAVAIYVTAYGSTQNARFGASGIVVRPATVQLLTPSPSGMSAIALSGLVLVRRRRASSASPTCARF